MYDDNDIARLRALMRLKKGDHLIKLDIPAHSISEEDIKSYARRIFGYCERSVYYGDNEKEYFSLFVNPVVLAKVKHDFHVHSGRGAR